MNLNQFVERIEIFMNVTPSTLNQYYNRANTFKENIAYAQRLTEPQDSEKSKEIRGETESIMKRFVQGYQKIQIYTEKRTPRLNLESDEEGEREEVVKEKPIPL